MNKCMFKSAALLLLAVIFFLSGAVAESYEATTMRLLRYDGNVEILDATGNARFVMENARFNSGESMHTGGASSASVGLDSSKIVTLDADTQVDFAKEASHLQMTLRKGTLFLDVQKKLDENEVLDIQTTTMTVGIRGTIVFVSEDADAQSGKTVLGVLEGTAQISYADPSGAQRLLSVPAGQIVQFSHTPDAAPVVSELVDGSLSDFVRNVVNSDPVLIERTRINELTSSVVSPAQEGATESYPADADWTWDEQVTFIAQSASKLFDGLELSRPSDVLVYGLPESFNATVHASGSQTLPGTSENRIADDYAIYNSSGENVTSHFTAIQTVSGQLVVDPAPVVIWTGSAEKIYDGTELTNPEAGFGSLPEREGPEWRNSALVTASAAGSQTLYVTSGVIWAHGTNPLTGEIREFAPSAGQRLTIFLHKDNDVESIEFKIENVTEEELPEAVLRLYAENPDLLNQACQDTGWDPEKLNSLIRSLPAAESTLLSVHELQVAESDSENLIIDSTDIRITIDSDITNYDARPLNTKEAHFYPILLPINARVTATGSQLEVGESVNTYEIDWASTNPACYVVSERLGTLRVLPVPVNYNGPITIIAASRQKVYNGTPLSANSFRVEGLPDGYSLEASIRGRRTDAGSSANVINSYTIYNDVNEDVTDLFTNVTLRNGSLTVVPANATITTDSASKMYDGTPLTAPGADISGLAAGESATVTATGSITEIGTARNTYRISWGSADPSNYSVSENLGTLEVTGYTMAVTITAPSETKTYDGDPLLMEGDIATVTGLPAGFTCVTSVSGRQTNAGSSASTVTDYTIYDESNADVTDLFTSVSRVNGTLTVTPAELTITTGSETKTYDGTPLTYPEASASGLVGGDNNDSFGVFGVGSITDAGTQTNGYSITWGNVNPGNYSITENLGTLTVTKAVLEVSTASDDKEYDGTPLTRADGTEYYGLVGSDSITLTATGSITNVGTTDNTYSIDWGNTNSNNYTIVESLGTLEVTVNTNEIIIASGSATKDYDGTPLTEGNTTVTGLSDAFSINCSVSGSQTIVGASPNTIASYQILDSTGADVSAYFDNVSTTAGTLTVNPNSTLITITAGSAERPYNGSELTSATATVAGLPAGFRADYTISGAQTDVGETDNTVASYTILNSDDEDVTTCFSNIQTQTGSLSVTPAPLTIQTGSATGTYNGTALTSSEVTVTGLANGETLSVTATGTITDAGTETNTYSIEWSTSTAGETNYTITTENLGTLTVEKATLRVYIPNDFETSKPYDGTPLTAPAPMIVGLVGDETATAIAAGEITDAGSAPVTASISWGTAKEQNYDVNYDDLGSLTITPADLYIEYTDAMTYRSYDGTPLTAPPPEVNGLADGETIEVIVEGEITDVGSVPVTATINWGTTKEQNYNVIKDLGSLTITPEYLYIRMSDEVETEKPYDGTPLTARFPLVEGLVDGETIEVTLAGEITDVGTVPVTATINWGTTKATNYNVITEDLPSLTITKAPLTIETGSVKAVYTGQPVTNPDYTVDGLADGETLVVVVTGTITDPGVAENTCYVDWANSTAKESNYDITYILGLLSVQN